MLASEVENTMVCVHKLQTVIVNAKNYDTTLPSYHFTTLRERLYVDWEDIAKFLGECHAYAGKVITLKHAPEESMDDGLEFLRRILTRSGELRDKSLFLLSRSEMALDEFGRLMQGGRGPQGMGERRRKFGAL